jgi:LPXTG-motif cell wall-anchored protein
MNNGYRSDQGSMSFVRLGDWKGGVSGLSLDGKKVDVETSPSAALVRDASGTITLSGSAVADRAACRTLDAPVGVTVTLPASCLASADPGNGGDPGDGGNPGNGGTPGDGSGPGSGAGTGTGASVGGDAGTSSTDAALASTGSDIAASVAIAVIVLLAGAGVLVIRRRRKRAE